MRADALRQARLKLEKTLENEPPANKVADYRLNLIFDAYNIDSMPCCLF